MNSTNVLSNTSTLIANPTATTFNSANTSDSIPPLFLLFSTLVTALGMAILSWFFKHYVCCCFKRNHRSGDQDSASDYPNQQEEGEEEEHEDVEIEIHMEEGVAAPREGQCHEDSVHDNDNDTASTIPSIITISRRRIAPHRGWGFPGRRQGTRIGATTVPTSTKQASSTPVMGRRFSRRRRSGSFQRRRRRRRRNRGRPSFELSPSPTTSRTRSTTATSFDHTTKTSSCEDDEDMSLPQEEVVVAATEHNDRTKKKHLASVDPRKRHLLEKPSSRSSKPSSRSYPNATIQFRNPINGKREHGGFFFEDGEIDLLVDFLVHTEEYIHYPRSKLTILLRARVPVTQAEHDELQHIRAIVEDAASSTEEEALASSSMHTSSTGNDTFAEELPQAQPRRPPLQVLITTCSSSGSGSTSPSDEDLLRCAPRGGILVTFGSVWELPEDHPDFLRDLVV